MKVDVIVIGSGQAGVPLAARLAEAGRRVLLAEARELGSTCVNDGCTPTKTMIASARAAHVARHAGRLGVRTGEVARSGGRVGSRSGGRRMCASYVRRGFAIAGDEAEAIRVELTLRLAAAA